MKTHRKTIFAVAVLVALLGQAHADPVTLTWISTTTTGTTVPGSVVGEMLTTTITVNNGGNSLLSQAWTAADFVSYRQEGASGWWIESTGISGASNGAFTTNALGAVLTAGTWYGGYPNATMLTSWAGTQLGGWWNNGNNEISCLAGSINCVRAVNVAANLSGASWTAAFPVDANTVPEPASLGLAGLALVLAGMSRKRRAA